MKKIILFDMDGTITPARKKMSQNILQCLIKLQNCGYEIGIVTGSDMDYLKEQCEIMFNINSFDFSKVHYLPCNGTKYYKIDDWGHQNTVYEKDMISEIGKENYQKILTLCFLEHINILSLKECPFTGVFFQYRGSMLNWCPIGRASKMKERKVWEKLDHNNLIRFPIIEKFRNAFSEIGLENVRIKLGGETSFDIFPNGWDKTFCLSNFTDYDEIIFIGDRCNHGGNDKEIYEKVKSLEIGKSFKTTGPKETMEIINKICEGF